MVAKFDFRLCRVRKWNRDLSQEQLDDSTGTRQYDSPDLYCLRSFLADHRMYLRAPEMHSHNWHVQVSGFADTAVREADVVLSIGYVAEGAECTATSGSFSKKRTDERKAENDESAALGQRATSRRMFFTQRKMEEDDFKLPKQGGRQR